MQHASDSKHCRRCGAAYVYDAVYLGHLGRYRCPSCGQRRPEPACRRRADRAGRHPRRQLRAAHPGRAAPTSRCRCPASTTSTTRSAPRRCAWRWASRWTRSPPGWSAVSAAFGRAERIAIGDRELSILLIKNPAGANEILRTLALGAGELDLLGDPQRPHRRRPRRLLDLGRRLRAAGRPRAPRHLRRHPRRRAGAAAQVRRRRRRAPARDRRTCRRRSTQALARPPGGRLFALPTYTALLELREELAAPRARRPLLGSGADAGAHERRSGTTSSAARYGADLPLWRELAASAAARCSTSAPAPAGSRSSWPAPAIAVDRARPRPRAARRAARAAADGLRRRDRASPTPATSRSERRFALCIVPMQTIQLLGGAERPRPRSCDCAREHLRAGGAAGDRARRRARAVRGRSTAVPARCPTCASSTASSTPASRPRCAPTATASCSSAGARRDRRRRAARSSDDLIRLDRLDADAARARGRRASACGRPGGRGSPPPTTTSAAWW